MFDETNGCIPKCSVINIDKTYDRKSLDSLQYDGRKVVSFGLSNNADFIFVISKKDIDGSSFEIENKSLSHNFSSHLFGYHDLQNIAASFATCRMICNELERCIKTIANFEGVPGRLAKIILRNGATAFVDYAHTPEALKSVIKRFSFVRKGSDYWFWIWSQSRLHKTCLYDTNSQ